MWATRSALPAILCLLRACYLMLVLDLFLSTVSSFREILKQDYWIRFLKFKKGVRVLY